MELEKHLTRNSWDDSVSQKKAFVEFSIPRKFQAQAKWWPKKLLDRDVCFLYTEYINAAN